MVVPVKCALLKAFLLFLCGDYALAPVGLERWFCFWSFWKKSRNVLLPSGDVSLCFLPWPPYNCCFVVWILTLVGCCWVGSKCRIAGGLTESCYPLLLESTPFFVLLCVTLSWLCYSCCRDQLTKQCSYAKETRIMFKWQSQIKKS